MVVFSLAVAVAVIVALVVVVVLVLAVVVVVLTDVVMAGWSDKVLLDSSWRDALWSGQTEAEA